VKITVADDGGGFDPEQLPEGMESHFGLAFMHERMAQVGGQLAIESQPGVGTRVVLHVPWRSDSNPNWK
jgi:signal transduction histidine kinase